MKEEEFEGVGGFLVIPHTQQFGCVRIGKTYKAYPCVGHDDHYRVKCDCLKPLANVGMEDLLMITVDTVTKIDDL